MKFSTKLIYTVLTLLVISACKKYDFNQSSTGEAVGDFTVKAPASNSSIVLNAATPNDPIIISWNASKPGVNNQVIYTWIAALKTGSLDNPIISLTADNSGLATQLTATQKQLDDGLKAAGIANAAKADLQWSVVASNGTGTKTRAGNTFNISITRFGDGVTPFAIYGPTSSAINLEINPTSTADFIVFKWQKATPAVAANTVKYQLNLILETGSFTQPLITITSGNNGTDTSLQVSWKQISDSLNKKGFIDLSQVSKLKWNVKATSGNFSTWSNFENLLYILRKVSFYVVGSFTGWNIDAPVEIIVDKKPDRYSKVFYAYMKLSAGDEFKFVKTKGDWGSAYGITGGTGGDYTVGLGTGDNVKITANGIYRLTIDVGANKAYIQPKQVGVVGNMQGWNAASPLLGGYIKANKFLIIAPSTGAEEFKLHDGTEWDNSAPNKSRWWGTGAGPGLLDLDGNGGNLVANSTPYIRAIWDGSDPQQVKYKIYKGKLRIVGGAPVIGDWNPDNALEMDYQGNGVWKKTVTFTGNTEFKFVIAEGWELNYGDAGAGAIKEDGGNLTRGAGTYTITVDEYNRTFTIL